MVTHSHSQRISGIKELRYFFQCQHTLQHFPYLLFVRIPVSCNGLLYFFRAVFGYGQPGTDGGRNSHTLCPAQLEHALHIFAKERRFDGKLMRTVFFYQLFNFLVNQLQPCVIIFFAGKLEHIHFFHAHGGAPHYYYSVAHQQRAGINAENYFYGLLQQQSIFTSLMRLNKNIKIFLNYILGPLLFAWLSYSIFMQVKNQPHLAGSWEKIKESFGSSAVISLVAVFVLMLINWSLEALKWKLAVQSVQPVTFLRSLRAIFSGVSFSVTTPNRTGEYLGRVLYMDEGNRLRVISLTMLGSYSQVIVTFFFGLIGLYILKPAIVAAGLSGWPTWINLLLSVGAAALVFLTVIYFRIGWLIKWIDKLPGIKKYAWLISELEKANASLLLRLLSLSALRYGVFVLQYYLLLRFFAVETGWWQAFWAISLVFFIMAVVPTVALFEVVQKIYVAKEIFTVFSANTLGIGFVTTTVWFINLVLPAAIGSLLILGIKLFKKQHAAS